VRLDLDTINQASADEEVLAQGRQLPSDGVGGSVFISSLASTIVHASEQSTRGLSSSILEEIDFSGEGHWLAFVAA
jgi:hypothetical protein